MDVATAFLSPLGGIGAPAWTLARRGGDRNRRVSADRFIHLKTSGPKGRPILQPPLGGLGGDRNRARVA